MSNHPLVIFIINTTEPIIAPIRKVLPGGNGAMAMIDWSPLVALILVDLARWGLVSFFS